MVRDPNTENILGGLERGFVNESTESDEIYIPRLLTNSDSGGVRVLNEVRSELENCDEFLFSVAFITEGGIKSILGILRDLRARGVRGKILASQYQNFTMPRALREILRFDNIELRIVNAEEGMHTKGYIFRRGGEYSFIVGSSNLTQDALGRNKEWNVKLNSTTDGSLIHEIIVDFDRMFADATVVDENWLMEYEKIYDGLRIFRDTLRTKDIEALDSLMSARRINPNSMQVEALRSLESLRAKGEKRALLISATGTGKTYLSAFDVRKFAPKRFLFIVHRELILKKALESFRRVIGDGVSMGLFTGNRKDRDADYLFATIQTMSRPEILFTFDPCWFDYIVIDEVHHSAADSYQKVINHFTPRFMLGMSATPERHDQKMDIFALFDHNIAYEIRLKQAMEANLVCPFHYFGINDLTVNGEVLEDHSDFAHLTADERVRNIVSNIREYGYCGDRLRGIVFCGRGRGDMSEAKVLCEKVARFGYRTAFLNAESSQEEREATIRRLESDDEGSRLDYIFVVDLFNEGVDIPSVNQVIMLRPTESPTVFIQQLGRGLRKADGKECVVVLDFIGNYENNYMIPIALTGDRRYRKDALRSGTSNTDRSIPGASTVDFEPVVKERIFRSIDQAKLSAVRELKRMYRDLSDKLGRIPRLTEFEEHGTVDAMKYIEVFRSYHRFLKSYYASVKEGNRYEVTFTEAQEKMLERISVLVCNGKRVHELVMMQILLEGVTDPFPELFRRLEAQGIVVTEQSELNLRNIFSGRFFGKTGDCPMIINGAVDPAFSEMLRNNDFRDAVEDAVALGYQNHESYRTGERLGNFSVNKLYSYFDVCRLLDWPVNLNGGVILGYMYEPSTNTFPVFINYVKGDDVTESQRYEDHFVNPSVLIAAPKSSEKREDNKNIVRIKDERANDTKVLLFVRKSKEDEGSKEFYFLGRMRFDAFDYDSGSMMIRYRLERPVDQSIYSYLMAKM